MPSVAMATKKTDLKSSKKFENIIYNKLMPAKHANLKGRKKFYPCFDFCSVVANVATHKRVKSRVMGRL